MFNNNSNLCADSPRRLDPEEVLENIRKRKAAVDEAKELLVRLTELPVYFNSGHIAEQAVAAMVGDLYMQSLGFDKDKQRVLADIAK